MNNAAYAREKLLIYIVYEKYVHVHDMKDLL